MQICIIGNCQAQMLESIIGTVMPDITIKKVAPNFELTDADQSAVMSLIESCDAAFFQRMADDYPVVWMRSRVMKDYFGPKLKVWPNIYFDGYFPDVQYVYTAGGGKLVGPLEDYHIGRIMGAFKNGLTERDAVELFEPGRVDNDQYAYEWSFSRLRKREAETDIVISDYLEGRVEQEQLFYTPNHPKNVVLFEMARRLLATLDGGRSFDDFAFGYKLDRIVIPPFRSIPQAGFDRNMVFQGRKVVSASGANIELGETQVYTADELVTEYYRVYRAFYGA